MRVESDPYGDLPMRNDKYAGLCTELHLGNRKITDLCGFEAFSNLTTLWINNNRIAELVGLENNFRLRNLYAHGNRIKYLEGSCLEVFKFLNNLTLNDNHLEVIQDVIDALKHLRHLESLDLFNNPIAQEDNYRLLIIGELPWLHVLDRKSITDEERRDAKKLRKKLQALNNIKLTSRRPRSEEHDLEAEREAMRQHERLKDILKPLFATKRIFFERDCLPFDPRKLGFISEEQFLGLLRQYGIAQQLTDDELSALVNHYRKKCIAPAISPAHTLKYDRINYREFCADILPKHLRVLPDKFVMDTVPDVSICVRDLKTFVKATQLKNTLELEKSKRNIYNATFDTTFTVRSNPLDCYNIDAWTANTIRKLLRTNVNSQPGSIDTTFGSKTISAEKLSGVMRRMREEHGKEPSNMTTEDFISLMCPDGEAEVAKVAECLGCGYGSFDMRTCVVWRDCDAKDLETCETVTFRNANQQLETLLRANPAESKALFSQTLDSSITATRLAAKKPARVTPVRTSSPADVITHAPNRADVIVIPSLRAKDMREQQEKEFSSTYNWGEHFSKLGLRREALDIALDRKKRSTLNVSPLKFDKHAPYVYNPKPKDRPKKGWGETAGTFVIS